MKTVTVMIIMGRERDRWGYPGRYGEEEGEEEEGLVWEYSSSWIKSSPRVHLIIRGQKGAWDVMCSHIKY